MEKTRDFIDRVDMWVCIPPVHPAFSDGNYFMEQCDLACLLIRKLFPKVSRIEGAVVLALSAMLTQSTSRRGAERSVFSSKAPSGTTFAFDNLPMQDQKTYGKEKAVASARGIFLSVKVKK